MSEACQHGDWDGGACTACGQVCDHDIVLNGACYYCGTTELDGIALSPKPRDQLAPLIPAARLVRSRDESD